MSIVYARNWWGAAWVEKLEKLAEPHRFKEGDNLARQGRVLSVSFEGRTIAAVVQANKEPAYSVRISIEPFVPEQWERLFAEVRDRRELLAALVTGDLPLELQTAYSRAKLRFMPERYTDLHIECPCADWLKPCRHLVAAWLKFAREFDRDPFLVFELRGLRRADLPALLSGSNAAAMEEAGEPEEFPEIAAPITLESLPADPDRFWSAPPLPAGTDELPDRALEDDDIVEKLRHWKGLEPQFRRIYDSVYELGSLVRS